MNGDQPLLTGGEPIEHDSVRFETRDVRYTAILALLAVIGCYLLVHFSVVWYFFRIERHSEEESKRSSYPFAAEVENQLPREPRLEPIDRLSKDMAGNMALLMAQKEEWLHSSGTLEEKGFMHIPIEQAMKEVVSQLPVRKPPESSNKEPQHDKK
jgi:hypothetical protein